MGFHTFPSFETFSADVLENAILLIALANHICIVPHIASARPLALVNTFCVVIGLFCRLQICCV